MAPFFFARISAFHLPPYELRGSISGSVSTIAPRIQNRLPSNQKIATCSSWRASSSASSCFMITATLHSQCVRSGEQASTSTNLLPLLARRLSRFCLRLSFSSFPRSSPRGSKAVRTAKGSPKPAALRRSSASGDGTARKSTEIAGLVAKWRTVSGYRGQSGSC